MSTGGIKVRKVLGKTNMADAFIKALDPGELEEHMREVGIQWNEGRHHVASEVSGKAGITSEGDDIHEGIMVGDEEEAEEGG